MVVTGTNERTNPVLAACIASWRWGGMVRGRFGVTLRRLTAAYGEGEREGLDGWAVGQGILGNGEDKLLVGLGGGKG